MCVVGWLVGGVVDFVVGVFCVVLGLDCGCDGVVGCELGFYLVDDVDC